MLRRICTVTISASLLLAAQAYADVYKYTDESGNIQYTDKPATLPAERLNVQSQRTDTVALQARQEAEQERMNAAANARQQNSAQRNDANQAAKMNATDKAEKCKQARERYDSYMNSQRLYEQQADGERRYLSDAELDAARASSKASMDVLCK